MSWTPEHKAVCLQKTIWGIQFWQGFTPNKKLAFTYPLLIKAKSFSAHNPMMTQVLWAAFIVVHFGPLCCSKFTTLDQVVFDLAKKLCTQHVNSYFRESHLPLACDLVLQGIQDGPLPLRGTVHHKMPAQPDLFLVLSGSWVPATGPDNSPIISAGSSLCHI